MLLIIKTPNDVNDVVLGFLLLTLTYFTPFSTVSVVDFEQVNVSWNVPIVISKTRKSQVFLYMMLCVI